MAFILGSIFTAIDPGHLSKDDVRKINYEDVSAPAHWMLSKTG